MNSKAIVDATHYEAFRKIIEDLGPDAVFTHWPIDNHADHRAISMLAYDAWLKLKKKFAFYYYEVSNGEDTVQFAQRIMSIFKNRAAQTAGMLAMPASRPTSICIPGADHSPSRNRKRSSACGRVRSPRPES